MPNLSDAFDWAFRRTLAVFEDQPSKPSDLPIMVCRTCNGHGFAVSDPCVVCDGTGEVAEKD